MTTWIVETRSDHRSASFAPRSDLSIGQMPDGLWSRVLRDHDYDSAERWRVDMKSTLVDLRWLEDRWLLVTRGRGAAFGTIGTYQLILPPQDLRPGQMWATVMAGRDAQGLVDPQRLQSALVEVERLATTAQDLSTALRGIAEARQTIIVPRTRHDLGAILELVPEPVAREYVWSTCHIPRHHVPPVVSGPLPTDLADLADESWAAVERGRERRLPGPAPRIDESALLWAARATNATAAAEGRGQPDRPSWMRWLSATRPRTPAELFVEHGVATLDDDAPWSDGLDSLLQLVEPEELLAWAEASHGFGRLLIEQTDDRFATRALEHLMGGPQDRDPLGLLRPRGPSANAIRLLHEQPMAVVIDLAERVRAETGIEPAAWALRADVLQRIGLSRDNAPHLFPFSSRMAGRLLAERGVPAFVAHLEDAGSISTVEYLDALREARLVWEPAQIVEIAIDLLQRQPPADRNAAPDELHRLIVEPSARQVPDLQRQALSALAGWHIDMEMRVALLRVIWGSDLDDRGQREVLVALGFRQKWRAAERPEPVDPATTAHGRPREADRGDHAQSYLPPLPDPQPALPQAIVGAERDPSAPAQEPGWGPAPAQEPGWGPPSTWDVHRSRRWLAPVNSAVQLGLVALLLLGVILFVVWALFLRGSDTSAADAQNVRPGAGSASTKQSAVSYAVVACNARPVDRTTVVKDDAFVTPSVTVDRGAVVQIRREDLLPLALRVDGDAQTASAAEACLTFTSSGSHTVDVVGSDARLRVSVRAR